MRPLEPALLSSSVFVRPELSVEMYFEIIGILPQNSPFFQDPWVALAYQITLLAYLMLGQPLNRRLLLYPEKITIKELRQIHLRVANNILTFSTISYISCI